MLLQLQTSDNQTLATNKTITNMLQKFWQEDVNVLKKLIWKPDQIPKVFFTDRDAALRNALDFPSIDPPAKKTKSTNKPVDRKSGKDKPVDPWKQFMGSWKWVTYAKSPELYTERFQNLQGFLSTRPAVLAYLEKNIIPVEELFVVAWACCSTGDFLSVFQASGPAVNAQILAINKSIDILVRHQKGYWTIQLIENLARPQSYATCRWSWLRPALPHEAYSNPDYHLSQASINNLVGLGIMDYGLRIKDYGLKIYGLGN
ncbi:hypothetical protein PSTG_13473 [Puccinia striiformis f. sp. tritici PST-78]|uniref:MULE transposase domain-containing protein n=1 Tax=Puccinia striiformis f. sp. tritici PST-78 TaxID=1165861 RepID=A0A0L0V1M0_9BASI|nr:hypothetical protein PSTG_13473 [Puccinia striiformis f. sp. tritici PST-78]